MSAGDNTPRVDEVDDWVTLLAEELEDRSGMMAEDIEHQIRAFAPGPVAAPAPSAGFPSSVYVKSAGESGDLLFAVRGAGDPGAVEYRLAAEGHATCDVCARTELPTRSFDAGDEGDVVWCVECLADSLLEEDRKRGASASVSDGGATLPLTQFEARMLHAAAHFGVPSSPPAELVDALARLSRFVQDARETAAPSAGDVERNVEAAVRCCRLAGLRVTPGSRPLPSGVDVGDSEREAGERAPWAPLRTAHGSWTPARTDRSEIHHVEGSRAKAEAWCNYLNRADQEKALADASPAPSDVQEDE